MIYYEETEVTVLATGQATEPKPSANGTKSKEQSGEDIAAGVIGCIILGLIGIVLIVKFIVPIMLLGIIGIGAYLIAEWENRTNEQAKQNAIRERQQKEMRDRELLEAAMRVSIDRQGNVKLGLEQESV